MFLKLFVQLSGDVSEKKKKKKKVIKGKQNIFLSIQFCVCVFAYLQVIVMSLASTV